MTNIDGEIEKLLPRLLLDSADSRRESIASIEKKHTSEAKGVNVDHIFYIENLKGSVFSKNIFAVEPLYIDLFNEIKNIYPQIESYSLHPIIDLIRKSGVIESSKELSKESRQEYFNYCVGLSDRYIPIIPLDINQKITSIVDMQSHLDKVHLDYKNNIKNELLDKYVEDQRLEKLNKGYLNNSTELKKELCNYTMLWIHAYRFLKARQQLLSMNKNVVAFSHRYQGWSKPRQKINEVLDIEFKTNFGYGNSSYFYLLLIYKGIKIFPYMDWINYKYAAASEMEGYSARFHKKVVEEKVYKGRKVSTERLVIKQEFWEQAFNSLVVACNISERSSEEFIDIYIISALQGLVSALESIIDEEDTILNNKYRDFEFGFTAFDDIKDSMRRVKLMSVKGSMISKTLDFIGEITKLEEIVNVSSYVDDIESLNRRILPMLEKTILSCEEIMSYMDIRFKGFEDEIVDIWKKQGLEEYTKRHKNKSLTVQEGIVFNNLQEKHSRISTLKGKAKQDLDNSRKILKSIEYYIINIKNYFDATKVS